MNSSLEQKIQQYIYTNKLIKENSRVIIGLSGGPDSVCLLHILAGLQTEFNLTLIAAHLNHEWRKNAANDIDFCKEFAHKLDIEFVTQKASELKPPMPFTGSKEEIGREMRRFFFEQLAQECNAQAIALGHHLQDQEETFLIRLIRGSSLTGLTCMKPKEGSYIRPLLEVTKEEILSYLNDNNIVYLVDPSNEWQDFLRNRIRSKVIPELVAADNRFHANFSRTLAKLQETDKFINSIVDKTFEEITSQDQALKLREFLQLDSFLQHKILLKWLIVHDVPFTPTESFFDEIMRFLKQPASGVHQMHETWAIEKLVNKNLVKIKK